MVQIQDQCVKKSLNLRHLLDIRSRGSIEGTHRAYRRCPSWEGRCGEKKLVLGSMRRGLEGSGLSLVIKDDDLMPLKVVCCIPVDIKMDILDAAGMGRVNC